MGELPLRRASLVGIPVRLAFFLSLAFFYLSADQRTLSLIRYLHLTVLAICLGAISDVLAEDSEAEISASIEQQNGVLLHRVKSRFQTGETEIRVLLPKTTAQPAEGFPVIYVLPVEANRESRYGDGLKEILRQRLHQKHQAIFVAPTFSNLPWYADHPDDPTIAQETYFLQVVVPFIEKTYPAATEPEGRLLLGFSKSGWGAWSLLLRHPEIFGRSAAWDAPMMMDTMKYGSAPIFGTLENFEGYHIRTLLTRRSEELSKGDARLILTGIGNFESDHEEIHRHLVDLTISHVYRNHSKRKHDWHSGWVNEAVELLLAE